jgi:hypothetical protein
MVSIAIATAFEGSPMENTLELKGCRAPVTGGTRNWRSVGGAAFIPGKS